MIVELNNIEKNYDRKVLKEINYRFESGKIYIIKGVSGCGKTTLLNILGGLETNYTGKLTINGEDKEGIKSKSGYIFQSSLLLSGLSVKENLRLIRNDDERILDLCTKLGVAKLIDKYPDELSGGERQRIAVVRAILNDPSIILADEPTASLDGRNSENVASAFAALKNNERIIIIATHEHYFDEYADEILELNYGELTKIYEKEHKEENHKELNAEAVINENKAKNISAIKYNLKRNRQNLSLVSLLPFVVMFLLVLLVSTVQNSFQKEYIRKIQKEYPIDTFNYQSGSLDYFPYKDKVVTYDYYHAEEDGVEALYLADEKYSVFIIDGMIQYGSFPQKNNEVIVTHEYIESIRSKTDDYAEYIGKTIEFKNNEYVISGILYSMDTDVRVEGRNEKFSSYYYNDIYYMRKVGKIIYIPYEKIAAEFEKEIFIYWKAEYHRGYIKDLYSDSKVETALRDTLYGTINIFDSEVKDSQRIVDNITAVLFGIFIVCFVIACIFISSQIQIELFYRRKELGYLQIFGLKKKRICSLVLTGYILKISLALIISMILYIIVILIYKGVTGGWVICNIVHILIVIFSVYVFYILTICISTNRFLKRDVKTLIEQ